MPFCPYKHLNINYTETGNGRVIVLLHGFLENLHMWDDYVFVLSKRYRVVCVDLLGHGKTDCHGYVHTMEDIAEGVNTVLRHLNVRRYIMIGHSMGGYVALAYGDLFPDNLIGLGLFFSTSHEDSSEKKELRLRAMEAVKKHHDLYIHTSIPNLFYKGNLKIYKEEVDNLIAQAKKISIQGIVASLAGMRDRPDRSMLLEYGPNPVLIISGKRDRLIPIEVMEAQMRQPMVTHSYVTEHGHMGHIENREECLKMIKRFIIDTHDHHNSLP